jgi:sterol desaturase/sphingolipid hydroxylase (fatty acid hydroxylase superfamily)
LQDHQLDLSADYHPSIDLRRSMLNWHARLPELHFIASLCLTLGVGTTAEASTVVLLAATFCTIFQHANIRTPRWLGYLVQRPESHSLHHERGVHARNYSDLPLFDLLFGTFANPTRFAPAIGPGARPIPTDTFFTRTSK